MGAAFLAACGGGSSDSKPKEQASSLVAQTVDETKSVQRGGTFKNFSTRDIPAFEPHSFAAASIAVVAPCYSNLWRVQEGYTTQTSGEIVGDLVESWEFSPDRTTLTAKLHQGAHFSPQAPTNGRVVDSQDVLFSWNRIKAISTRRGELANDIDPNAPITSITAPDDKTVVIKMKEPTGTILALLSTAIQGLMIIAPKEGADTKVLNLATTVRGSGPWYLDQQTPGARYTFKRNPGFQQDKRNLPYIDEIEWPVVSEYAQAMAQFRTGSIYAFTTARAEDILPMKQDVPELVVMGTDFQTPLPRPYFGVQASSPFKDARVRQAFALTWDRDLFIDTVYNVSKFKSQGVNIDTAWELALQANTWKDWMLDGRDKNFGPNAKFFKKDVAEAKKLMSAAGFNSVLTVDNNTPTGVVNQGAFDQAIDIITGMAEESGLFKLTRKLSNFNTDFIPRFQDAKGNFDGMAYTLSSLTIDPYNYLKSYYHPSGAQRQGTDDTFRDLIDKAGKEFDDKKRQAILHDVQRHEAETLFFPRIGAATGLQIFWPVLRNVNVWQGGSGRPNATVFLDPTKAPLKKP